MKRIRRSDRFLIISLLLLFSCSKNNVTDVDGNKYKTISIGTQVWMAENLKVTHYRNGDVIPAISDSATWKELTTGAYCNYNNDSANVAIYGRLYNWYAVGDTRNIAPLGFHVPSDAEWQVLVIYLGGHNVAGGKLKEAGLMHWYGPNTAATNKSGFTALPSGFRLDRGSYTNAGRSAHIWTSTENDSICAWQRYFYNDDSEVSRLCFNMNFGFSVRCIRD